MITGKIFFKIELRILNVFGGYKSIENDSLRYQNFSGEKPTP